MPTNLELEQRIIAMESRLANITTVTDGLGDTCLNLEIKQDELRMNLASFRQDTEKGFNFVHKAATELGANLREEMASSFEATQQESSIRFGELSTKIEGIGNTVTDTMSTMTALARNLRTEVDAMRSRVDLCVSSVNALNRDVARIDEENEIIPVVKKGWFTTTRRLVTRRVAKYLMAIDPKWQFDEPPQALPEGTPTPAAVAAATA